MNAQVRKTAFASASLAADDFETEITTAELARRVEATGTGASMQQLADLFHRARLHASPLRRRYDDLFLEASDLLPRQPEHWASQEARARYRRQCEAIHAGLGVDAAEEAFLAAEDITDTLAARVEKAPVRSLADLNAKLGVALFCYSGADEDGFMTLLGRLEGEVRGLLEEYEI